MEKICTARQLEELAGKLAKRLKPNDVLALYGDLGAGKTTFTGYLVKSLGFESRVQSPTFILVRNYSRNVGDIKKVYHVDLYRLKTVNEVLDIGLNEMVDDSGCITVIEWPEVIEDFLPDRTIKLLFSYVDENTRKVEIINYV